jgi:RNA polymerase sigma factor
VDFARSEPGIIEDFLRTRRIPLSAIAQATGESRKTLERHRRYLAVVLLIFSGGFETIQEHIIQTLKGGAER